MIGTIRYLAPLLLILTAGCDGGQPETPDATLDMPAFANERLSAGRSLWMGTCRSCHLLGVAGAPAVTDQAEWERRLIRGKEALYQSAIEGVRGPDGQYRMPPQGGNPRLSAEQVRLAVDYMVAASAGLPGSSR